MEMLYRLSYVGAHDGDHPSGQHGLDAERGAVFDWSDAGGLRESGCAEEKTHHPEGDLRWKVVLGCRAKRGI